MARAAVKAKQAQRAKAQPAKSAVRRGRRKHSGGGNPNQQLFFSRLRRRATKSPHSLTPLLLSRYCSGHEL